MSGILTDRVVVVAGVGPTLGRAVALAAARHGADVVLAARTGTTTDPLADEIVALGRKVLVTRTDLLSDNSCADLVRAVRETFGRVDALVNNAFAVPPMEPLTEVALDGIRASFETNVHAALRLTRLFAPDLAGTRGAVVMVNSVAVRRSQPTFGPYRMAKAALLAMAQTLSAELGPTGVRINTVVPGYIWSDAMRGWFEHLAAERGVDLDVVRDEVASSLDLRELPDADAVADAVVYLASPLARAVAGAVLDVNGGEVHP